MVRSSASSPSATRSTWPPTQRCGRACWRRSGDANIRNYSIFSFGEQLFAYFEYVGDDFAADMARMAADPETQRWWDVMMPMQQPLDGRAEGEWWASMTEVFHTE